MALVALAALVAALPSRSPAHDDPAHHRAELGALIAADPGSAPLYLKRADLSRALEDWPAAVSDLDEARRLDPGLVEADFLLARVRLESGEPDAALVAIDRYTGARPALPGGHLLRGRILEAGGRRTEAADAFDEGIRLARQAGKPASPDEYLSRSRCLAGDEGRTAEALEAAIRSLDEGLRDLDGAVVLQLAAIDLEVSRANWDGALRRVSDLERRATRRESWGARRCEYLEKAGRRGEASAACREALAAIDALPPRLRDSPATLSLKAAVEARLRSLDGEAGANGFHATTTTTGDPS